MTKALTTWPEIIFREHNALSTTGINFPCQSNLSDKIFTEKGAVSLIPKKDTR